MQDKALLITEFTIFIATSGAKVHFQYLFTRKCFMCVEGMF